MRLYPQNERGENRALEHFLIKHSYINHSLRLFRSSSGRTATVEQLFLPVANDDGVTDRFYMVLDNLKVLSSGDTGEGGQNKEMGRLIERTLFNPASLEPVASDFTLPALEGRDEAESLSAYL